MHLQFRKDISEAVTELLEEGVIKVDEMELEQWRPAWHKVSLEDLDDTFGG